MKRPQNVQCNILILESLLLLLLLHSFQTRAHISSVIVFGDSLVDAGNNNYINTLAKANFAPYGRDLPGGVPTGRFCNGRLSPDFTSEAFNLTPIIPAYLDPQYTIEQFASGICFASAATGFDDATASILNVISLRQQVEYYKEYQEKLKTFQGEAEAETTIKEALHIINLGSNDLMLNYYATGNRASQYTIEEYTNFLVTLNEKFVRDIYGLGARKLEIVELGPLGCMPSERAANLVAIGQCNEIYNEVTKNYNQKVKALVDKLNGELSDMKIVIGPVYDFFSDMISNPSTYGFENVVQGCCGTGFYEGGLTCNAFTPTCQNADAYIFWDAVHLTQRAYQILADHIFKTELNVFL